MNLKNDQEVFNFVAAHLFTQGKQALGFDEMGYAYALEIAKQYGHDDPEKTSYERCRYRAEDGCKCAVGVLIPDDLYDPRMENKGAWSVLGRDFQGMAELFEGSNKCMLAGLQHVHDCHENWLSTKAMKDQLRNVAREYKISADVLTNLKFEDR